PPGTWWLRATKPLDRLRCRGRGERRQGEGGRGRSPSHEDHRPGRPRPRRRAAVIVDYHMHLRNRRSEIAHDTSSVEPFVETARAAGIDEIGFTEHVYYFRQTRS